MNTYNHHRIIDKLAQKVNVDKDVLIKASDYTDDFVLVGAKEKSRLILFHIALYHLS